ncbi:GntR family transcriptional regulator [Rhizobium sp. VS19-DR104.2]|uniref:GntR family transcriptional regulator n=1 Tax=unclassified Rhizobium TaxID=2613769 RepID=UPI001CC733EE|nr:MULTISPECIES: GntR family transcriptional regulator [unclassified Rhizobium]MBZ5761355.1 GntR family transcriptional regulator [Rhizobium sp. VS19-DR96]MBZ5767109.1 GntR family transcriptional regulator [Rhizobium sp. VS19-DR129.2]MBZ5774994.1 GntR family transcriptional regulator [Rhizobium sp. VS19-DRK62.2]MBZ5785787.1 GntR family transcriptional regulator [Rhizobium sp. VS19-DR121]MBZ5803213.1 GntR family transcriptional regulator [Rhizobium sp. VS19-DR181]
MSDKETLAQQAYRDIKQRILEGAIKAGDLLTERTLAVESGISRTPLRAAISRLQKEGVVSRLTNGTLMILPVTVEQLLEIIQIRRLLEGAAAARAAGRPMTAALVEARRVMRAYVEAEDVAFDRFWMDDDAFHEAVAEAAGLRLLPPMLQEMRSIARRCTITRTHDRFAEQAAEHIAVIDAIEAQDADAAAAAMEAHFDSVRSRFLKWLAR